MRPHLERSIRIFSPINGSQINPFQVHGAWGEVIVTNTQIEMDIDRERYYLRSRVTPSGFWN